MLVAMRQFTENYLARPWKEPDTIRSDIRLTKNFSDRKFISYVEIDKSRYLIADDLGNLFILGFKPKSNNINIHNNTFPIGIHFF